MTGLLTSPIIFGLDTFYRREFPPAYNAGSHHDNNDDGGKRFHRDQGDVSKTRHLAEGVCSASQRRVGSVKMPLCQGTT